MTFQEWSHCWRATNYNYGISTEYLKLQKLAIATQATTCPRIWSHRRSGLGLIMYIRYTILTLSWITPFET